MALKLATLIERYSILPVLLVLVFIVCCPAEVIDKDKLPLWAKIGDWAWDVISISASMGGLLLAVLTLLQAMSALDGVKVLVRGGAWKKVVQVCLTSMYAWFGAAGATLLAIPLMAVSLRVSLVVAWLAITFASLRFLVCLLWVGQLLRGLEVPSKLTSAAQDEAPPPSQFKPLAFREETTKATVAKLELIRAEAPTDPSAA